MISGATPDSNCILAAPASISPTSSPAGMTAMGLVRASSAIVMPSKPSPTLTPASKRPSTPSDSIAPPRPASRPATAMVEAMIQPTEMPA